MPNFKLAIPKSTPWTKVPNFLLDELLPTLKDTELRLLLLLLRDTTGWNRPESAVKLTYVQLRHRSGRANEAISAAISGLSNRQLLHTLPSRTLRYSASPVRIPNVIHSKDNKVKEQPSGSSYPQGGGSESE